VNNLIRAAIALVAATLVGFATLAYFQASAEQRKKPTPQQTRSAEDDRLMAQLIQPTMSSLEADAVPTYSDFARVLKKGVVAVLRSRENLRAQLPAGTDLLDRYPPDGVPGRHLRAYLKQNSEWKQATLRSVNEQIRAIKDLRGDMYAFFASQPAEYDEVGKRFEETIKAALEARRPAASIVQSYASARDAMARKPTSVTRADFSRAATEYEAWKRMQ
jgi:hypothetical protein